jgi:hypothetical protein
MCKVLDASQVLVSGSALKMSPLGQPAVVMVDPQMSAGDLGTCDVTVTSPSGQTIPVRLTKTDKFTAEFMPSEVGELWPRACSSIREIMENKRIYSCCSSSRSHSTVAIEVSTHRPLSVYMMCKFFFLYFHT